MSEICIQLSDRRVKMSLIKQIMDRIDKKPNSFIWISIDFVDLGKRDAIDKALQRLVSQDLLQNISRGLYMKTSHNLLTKKLTTPDYQRVIEAIMRRSKGRILVDGMTAANALGLTNAVPSRVIIHTDSRLHSISIGNLMIEFKLTSPSKLYWAGHPAMYIVQALYWLRDSVENFSVTEQQQIMSKLQRIIFQSSQAKVIYHDLINNLHAVPTWMQDWIRQLTKGGDTQS